MVTSPPAETVVLPSTNALAKVLTWLVARMAPTATALAFSSAAPSEVVEFVVIALILADWKAVTATLPASAVSVDPCASAVTLVLGLAPNAAVTRLLPSRASTALNRKLLDCKPMVLKASTMPPDLLLPEVSAALFALILALFSASIDSVTGASGVPATGVPAPVAVIELVATSAVAEFWIRLVAIMPL